MALGLVWQVPTAVQYSTEEEQRAGISYLFQMREQKKDANLYT